MLFRSERSPLAGNSSFKSDLSEKLNKFIKFFFWQILPIIYLDSICHSCIINRTYLLLLQYGDYPSKSRLIVEGNRSENKHPQYNKSLHKSFPLPKFFQLHPPVTSQDSQSLLYKRPGSLPLHHTERIAIRVLQNHVICSLLIIPWFPCRP